MYIDDTIAAIATPPGIGGVGIIRVSGKDSFPIVNSLFKSTGTVPLMDRQNRTIQYGTIVDPATNKTIDEVLVLLMKGPHSYTAEDVVEIQCHGGIVPVRQILKLLVNHDVRMAEAGEFTKRAFMNGIWTTYNNRRNTVPNEATCIRCGQEIIHGFQNRL